MEDDLQQQIPELLGDVLIGAGFDRLQQLVRLVQQVLRERLVGLLGVPRTPAGPAQPRHHGNQVEQPVAPRRAPHDELDLDVALHAPLEDRARHGFVVEDERDLAALAGELGQPSGQRARALADLAVRVGRQEIPPEHPCGVSPRRLRPQPRGLGLRKRGDLVSRFTQPLCQRIAGCRENRRARQGLPGLERQKIRGAGPRPDQNQPCHEA